jgi:ABC-type multidrug transport system fused ATPase/permease subunit
MKFKQSISQSLFDRFYRSIGDLIIYFVVVFFLSFFYQSTSDSRISLFAFILIPIIYTLWLFVFNRGKGKVETFSITILEEGINICRYGNDKEISWDSFKGFKIGRWFPRTVKIFRVDKENIEFSYYALSSDQRKALFEILRRMER